MTHGEQLYSLDDLERLTGFTARQIRYYITRKLLPGAEERGPNARYPEESLRRLKLIAHLKTLEIQPTGRTPSLEEIRHMIDGLGPDGADQLIHEGAELKVIDTDELGVACARENIRPTWCSDIDMEGLSERITLPPRDPGQSLGPLADPLRQLRDLLRDVTANPNLPTDAGETWRRIRTPDIEIHVRAPGDAARRSRLERALHALESLLDRRSDHDELL